MKRMILVPALAIVFCGTSVPQDAADLRAGIKRSVEQRDHISLLEQLRRFKASEPKVFATSNHDYLLARTAEENGELALAMSEYRTVAGRDSILKAYALKHLSQIARSTGNLLLERLYLQELRLFTRESVLADSVLLRLAANAFESGNYAETIRVLNGAVRNGSSPARPSGGSSGRSIKLLLARAYLGDGQISRARQDFARLIETDPKPTLPDDTSNAAIKALDHIDRGSETNAPELPEAEHFRRADIYMANREFARARLHLAAVTANFPNSNKGPDAIFLTGRSFVQESDFVGAISEFERIREQYPSSNAARDALLQAASAYARVGKPREAIVRYQQFIEQYPGDEKLDRAYLNIVDVLRDQGEDVDALRWCGRTREAFSGKMPAALAAFAEARIHIAKENWTSALATLDQVRQFSDLGGSAVPGGTNAAEIAFLRAFVLEQLSRYPEAIDGYLAIPDGRGEYYGWRATQRLHALSSDETARSFIAQRIGTLSAGLKASDAEEKRQNATGILRMTNSPDLREKALAAIRSAIAELPRYQGVPRFKPAANDLPSGGKGRSTAKALFDLGLLDEASPEFEAGMKNVKQTDGEAGFLLASFYGRGDRGDRAIAFIEPIWRKMPSDYPIELIPRDHLDLLYPAPYADLVVQSARERGVDPRLMLAIMRQESRFRPDARSGAAARGLMQFIGQTAARVAGQLGRDQFDDEELYDPETSILFGSQYVANLFTLFPGQPEAVAASYNGGEDNMKRWFARSRSSLPERYVPEIVYSQTKDYVYKVMANYRMYQYLYDENLRPK